MTNRLLVLTQVSFAVVLVGCGGGGGSDATGGAGGTAGTGGVGGTGGTPGTAGTAGTGGTPGTTTLVRGVRFAHFAKSVPAVDVCYRSNAMAAGTYLGPVFKAAGSTAGLAFGQVGSFVMVDVGNFHYRLVAPNAADCSTPLFDFDPPFNMNGNFHMTVAVIPAVAASTAAHSTRSTGDVLNAPGVGTAALKLLNVLVEVANSAPLVDFGPVSGGVFTATFKSLSTEDSKAFAPPTAAAFELRQTGMTTPLVAASLTLAANTTSSGWVAGEIGSATNPPTMVICTNVATTGAFSTCKTY